MKAKIKLGDPGGDLLSAEKAKEAFAAQMDVVSSESSEFKGGRLRELAKRARSTAADLRRSLQIDLPSPLDADVPPAPLFTDALRSTFSLLAGDKGGTEVAADLPKELQEFVAAYEEAVAEDVKLSDLGDSIQDRAAAEARILAAAAIAASEAAEAKDRNLFVEGLQKFKDLGLSLREANEPVGFDRPATFNYTRNYRPDRDAGERSESLTTKAALIWTGESRLWSRRKNSRLSVVPQLAIETDIDTGRGKTVDQISIYAGIQLLQDLTPDNFRGWYNYAGRSTLLFPVQLQARYLTSTNGKYEEISAHLDFAPKVGAVAMGVRRGHEWGCCPDLGTASGDEPRFWKLPRNFISFMWQPRMAWDYGTVLDKDPAIPRTNDTLVRGVFDISGRIYFDGFARGLFFQSFNAGVGPLGSVWDQSLIPYFEVGYKLFWEDNLAGHDVNELTQLVFNMPLNAAISFDLKYTKGRDAPDYVYAEALEIAIGIKL